MKDFQKIGMYETEQYRRYRSIDKTEIIEDIAFVLSIIGGLYLLAVAVVILN